MSREKRLLSLLPHHPTLHATTYNVSEYPFFCTLRSNHTSSRSYEPSAQQASMGKSYLPKPSSLALTEEDEKADQESRALQPNPMLKKVQEKLMLVQELTLSTKETLPLPLRPLPRTSYIPFKRFPPVSASSISDDTLAEDENDYEEEKRMMADFLFPVVYYPSTPITKKNCLPYCQSRLYEDVSIASPIRVHHG